MMTCSACGSPNAIDAQVRPCEGALTGASRPPFTEACERYLAFGDVVVASRIGLEQAEWLVEQGRLEEASALLPPLRETTERLGEVHWRARLAAISQRGVTATVQG